MSELLKILQQIIANEKHTEQTKDLAREAVKAELTRMHEQEKLLISLE